MAEPPISPQPMPRRSRELATPKEGTRQSSKETYKGNSPALSLNPNSVLQPSSNRRSNEYHEFYNNRPLNRCFDSEFFENADGTYGLPRELKVLDTTVEENFGGNDKGHRSRREDALRIGRRNTVYDIVDDLNRRARGEHPLPRSPPPRKDNHTSFWQNVQYTMRIEDSELQPFPPREKAAEPVIRGRTMCREYFRLLQDAIGSGNPVQQPEVSRQEEVWRQTAGRRLSELIDQMSPRNSVDLTANEVEAEELIKKKQRLGTSMKQMKKVHVQRENFWGDPKKLLMLRRRLIDTSDESHGKEPRTWEKEKKETQEKSKVSQDKAREIILEPVTCSR